MTSTEFSTTGNSYYTKQKQLSFCENHISHVTALQVWIHNNHFKFTIQPQIHWMHKSHMQLQKHGSSGQPETTKGFNESIN